MPTPQLQASNGALLKTARDLEALVPKQAAQVSSKACQQLDKAASLIEKELSAQKLAELQAWLRTLERSTKTTL